MACVCHGDRERDADNWSAPRNYTHISLPSRSTVRENAARPASYVVQRKQRAGFVSTGGNHGTKRETRQNGIDEVHPPQPARGLLGRLLPPICCINTAARIDRSSNPHGHSMHMRRRPERRRKTNGGGGGGGFETPRSNPPFRSALRRPIPLQGGPSSD